ncbi:TetR/AcrR family transcriptional regulator [Comamonas odontotermitis]|uniref:TetR/AcrR family transcriptional regulator n=1 Tax=Comamonas TaxID=283 RepID=UPI001CC787A9|nr:TetR/AcrR family transcriptional regulator [Comamonas odontotermitis]UBB19104.1 TetR/AcrR family transcriptional regulator [Comamonas odontotermitis]
MARGRAPGYEDQREHILHQAAELFARAGYAATSMNEVASACGLSKPALYHYFKDKNALLLEICDAHITRLIALVDGVDQQLPAEPRLRLLIERFVQEYAHAVNEHRVLTEDVRFLNEEDQERILNGERQVVESVARAVRELRPQTDQAGLTKALTMLLFGMMNWMFTWLKPHGALSYDAMAPVVADLFLGGVGAVQTPGQKR